YRWIVDGETAGRGPSLRFTVPPAASAAGHTVELRVADRARAEAAPVAWRVAVSPRMSEADVREWLGRLGAAWQRRDVATLRLYGVVPADADEDAVRKRFPRKKTQRVSVVNAAIRTEGRFAAVAFDRVFSDEDGKIVAVEREALRLEKAPSGFVAVRQR
ncbi:MAG TPA: hypothetical protein VKA21_08900, partial [Candidatus Binatia bacterium]|nr:hypothetical protein [Candidatus Binatia bacterium]